MIHSEDILLWPGFPRRKPPFASRPSINGRHWANRDLLHWWILNEGQAGRIYDSLPPAFDATGTNFTAWGGWRHSPFGLCIDVNGSTTFFPLGAIPLSGSLTISAIIHSDSTSGNRCILGTIDSGGLSKNAGLSLTSRGATGRELYAEIGNGTSYQLAASGIVYGSQKWVYIGASCDGTDVRFLVYGYEDGQSTTATVSQTVGVQTAGYSYSLGRFGEGNFNYFDGRIADARIYGKALSFNEMLFDAVHPYGTEGSPRLNVPLLSSLSFEFGFGTLISGSLSDQLQSLGDSIGLDYSGFITPGGISSANLPITDSLAYSLTSNLSLGLADALEPVQDDISSHILAAHQTVAASDTLAVIQDQPRAGLLDVEGAVRWVAPLSIRSTSTGSNVDPLFLAAHAVRHPERYYEPRVKSYGRFDRSISTPVGFIRTGDVGISIADPDNSVRQRIAPKTIRKATAELRLGPEGGSYQGFLRPFRREVGTVAQPSDGELMIPLRDFTHDWYEWEVPGLINTDNFPNLPENPTSDFANLVIGNVASATGAIPCILVDNINHRYLVNRHPSKSVDMVFRRSGDQADFYFVSPSEYTVRMDIFLSHSLGWGDNCTIIQFDEDQAGAEIRANVQGIVDGDGNLRCTNFADCILEIFQFLVGVTSSIDRINFASFDDVRTKTASLQCAGAWTSRITFGEALTQLQRSSNIDIFNDRHDRITVAYVTEGETPSAHLDDLLRLYKGTVAQQLAEPTFNRIPYRFSYNFADRSWGNFKSFENVTDQIALGEVVEEEPLQMYFVRDAETARQVVEQRGSWLDLDSFRFKGEIPLIPTVETLELAQLVSIEHFGGIKAGGYASEQFKITDLSMDVDQLRYHFRGIRRCTAPERIETENIQGLPKINCRVGPHSRGIAGEMFAVFNREGSNYMKVIRTDDYGETWTESDAGNAPGFADQIRSFDSFVLNDIIHIVTAQNSSRISYHTFSMTDNEWVSTDELVVSSVANGGSHCVSIECRYPGEEPVIYFQGDKQLLSGQYFARGYYSGRFGGSWSSPVMVTPDPGTYYENNFGRYAAHALSGHCIISRVIAGRENRMHFFYHVEPAVTWVQWSPDEYGNTLQGDLSFSGQVLFHVTSVYYNAVRNAGNPTLINERQTILIPRKASWGQLYIDFYSEGPSLVWTRQEHIGNVPYESTTGSNTPTAYIREASGELYSVQATFPIPRAVSLKTSDGNGTWTDHVQAGPLRLYPNELDWLDGTILTACGAVYLAYFSAPGIGGGNTFAWIKVSSLPY